jgi:hypothetical protein
MHADNWLALLIIALCFLALKLAEYRWERNGEWHVYCHFKSTMRRWKNGAWQYRPMTAEERATIKDYTPWWCAALSHSKLLARSGTLF